MSKFTRNPFARSDLAFKAPAGESVVPEYMGVTMHDGSRVRQKVGEHSLDEAIQSYLDGCLIENILKRCALTGDYSALRAGNAQYIDMTGLPRSFAEVQQAMAEARSLYHTLPASVLKDYPTFEVFSQNILSDPSSDDFKRVCTALGINVPLAAQNASTAVSEASAAIPANGGES